MKKRNEQKVKLLNSVCYPTRGSSEMFDVVSGNIYLTLPNRLSNVSVSAPTQDKWKTAKVK